MRAARSLVAIVVLLAAAIAAPSAARSQGDYPNRPVTLIVPYAAGGGADVGMRIVSEKLSSRLNAQFVVENRPGAGGIVAAQVGAAAAPEAILC
jgi:tripartite-type tricarboxylate transporter receptor subunit TctC